MPHPLRTPRVILLLLLPVVLASAGGYMAYKQRSGRSPSIVATEASLDVDLKTVLDETEATDPGWRFEELNARRAALPMSENGANLVQAAANALPRDWPRLTLVDELSRLKASDPLSKQQLTDLNEELKKADLALTEARKLAEHPKGRYDIAWKRDYLSTELPHLRQIPSVEVILVLDAVRHIQENDPSAALASARALLNAGRSIGDEPMLASGLIRIGSHPFVIGVLERILAQAQPAEHDLVAVQRALEEEAAQPLLLIAARGERATLHNLLLALETHELKRSDLPDADNTARPMLHQQLLRVLDDRALSEPETFKHSHAWLLAYLTDFVEIAKLPTEEQRPRLEKLEMRRGKAPAGARRLMPAIGQMAVAFQNSQALLRCGAVALAAERYRQAKGHWPERLDDLTNVYLAAVPLDPFDGKPLRFRKHADGVVIYSVGADGQDNGGDLVTMNTTFQPGTDIGFRLWNVNKRRQAEK